MLRIFLDFLLTAFRRRCIMAVRSINSRRQQEQQEQAKIWLNIVVKSAAGDLISLPYGIALDTMKDAKVSGDPEWRAMAKARNEFLAQLLALSEELEEGEGQILTGVQVQMYKKQEENDAEEVMHELPHISFSF
jgi:hypothetical protein